MLVHTMLKTTIAGMRLHKLRTLLTGLAVVIGVSLLAGTLIYGDTAKAAFFDDSARPATNVDVSVQPFGPPILYTGRGAIDPATVRTVAAVPGVAAVDGRYTAPLAMLSKSG